MKRAAILLLILALLMTGCAKDVQRQTEEADAKETCGPGVPETEELILPPEDEKDPEAEITAGETEPEPAETDPVTEDPWGITMRVEDVTPTGAVLVLLQNGAKPEGELHFGAPFTILRLRGDGWEEVPYIVEGGVSWNQIAYGFGPEGKVRQNVNWESIYGSLDAGTYRLQKEFLLVRAPGDYDSRVYSAEFSVGIEEGAILSMPPELIVQCGEERIAAMQGTCTWTHPQEDGTCVTICADSMHPLQAKEFMPVLKLQASGDTKMASLRFAMHPQEISVLCWPEADWDNMDAKGESVEVQILEAEVLPGQKQPAPAMEMELKEGYIYEVTARWPEMDSYGGIGRYGFCTAALK